MQVCPAAMNPAKAAPLAVASIGASSKTMTGDLPPSSTVTLAKCRAAATATDRPGSVPPVNVIFATSGCSHNAAPATGPSPLMMLSTPSGNPDAVAISPSLSVVSGVCSEGLRTTLLPVANAGARLFEPIISGWLNDDRMPTTPNGKRCVYEWYGPGIGTTAVRSATSSEAL